MSRKTKATTTTTAAPKTPARRRPGQRGGKRRRSAAVPVIDAGRGFILEDSYVPDGSDPDDT